MAASPELSFMIVAVATVLGLAIVFGTVTAMITKIMTARAREQTRREIAAYVAEGSIAADDAVAMIRAGRSPGEMAGEMAVDPTNAHRPGEAGVRVNVGPD